MSRKWKVKIRRIDTGKIISTETVFSHSRKTARLAGLNKYFNREGMSGYSNIEAAETSSLNEVLRIV